MTTLNGTIQAIKHTDVRGKELLYLKLTANGNDVLVNIGKKTFDAVEDMQTIRKTTPTQEELKEKTKGGKK